MIRLKKKYQNIHQDLINKCIKGDENARFRIYELYYKQMYNTCFRIVRNTEEAEELMQDAFLSAFDKLKTYKFEVSFGAWLKKIAINKSLDELKKRKLNFTDFEKQSLSVPDELPIENEETKIIAKKIRAAIIQLPDKYRIFASLYLLEGYDHEEIGQILGISPSTSRSGLSRAKQKIVKYFQ